MFLLGRRLQISGTLNFGMYSFFSNQCAGFSVKKKNFGMNCYGVGEHQPFIDKMTTNFMQDLDACFWYYSKNEHFA